MMLKLNRAGMAFIYISLICAMSGCTHLYPTWSNKMEASKRFLIALDGEAVLDKETGLVWEKLLRNN